MQDFMQCLPFPEYAHPGGSLNVANYLSQDLVKPDLGPKSYIATGRSLLFALHDSHLLLQPWHVLLIKLSVQPRAV